MQINFIHSDSANQLLCLLRMLRIAMQGALENDEQAFEQAINDLDTKLHFHDHQSLGLEGGNQYRLVRELLRYSTHINRDGGLYEHD